MDEDFSLDELRLAFSYHIANQIVGADGRVAPEESEFVARAFPKELLASSGFVDEAGAFTQRWNDALGEALLRLPELSVPDRVAIVETLFGAAMSDAAFLAVEAETVRRAARLLGLSAEQVAELASRWETAEAEPTTAASAPLDEDEEGGA